MFRTRFWGVRGSIAAPGPATAEIGGNTSCVELLCGDTRLVFDGGTGLRILGNSLVESGEEVRLHLFFSHVHWDHIQGFPFFVPAFTPGNTLNVYGAKHVHGSIQDAMAGQMRSPNFPVRLDQLPSTLHFHDVDAGQDIRIDDVVVRAVAGNHPGGVLAYRIEYDGKVVVYATDTEQPEEGRDERIVRIAEKADLFIYDSQYTPEEYSGRVGGRPKVGWGHSTFEAGADISRSAGVDKYVLFHHDPDQDDGAVREKERRAKDLFPNSLAAYEGLSLDI